MGNVRQALEAKLGARRLEAEIQACSFSKVYIQEFRLGFAGWCGPEVGKMTTFYLLPIPWGAGTNM